MWHFERLGVASYQRTYVGVAPVREILGVVHAEQAVPHCRAPCRWGPNRISDSHSGMAPLKRYFTGEEQPPGRDPSNVQPCIRTRDIEDVGDRHHLTFCEMLGSWSIGGYFEARAVERSNGWSTPGSPEVMIAGRKS